MHIIRHVQHCPEQVWGSVAALGNFDGIHRGHQEIIRQTIATAKKLVALSAVMTFEPHPRTLFEPAAPPFRITPMGAKLQLLESLGVDIVFLIPFNDAFSRISASAFIEDILGSSLHVRHIVIGDDFIFGHRRQGNLAMLKQAADKGCFGITQVLPVESHQKIRYASSQARTCIHEGMMKDAEAILGRPFAVTGRVRQGEQRGRQLGFPTANIRLPKTMIRPRYGVYKANVRIQGESPVYPAIANFGIKPTFGEKNELLEVHLFEFNKDVYGKKITVEFLDFIRPEKAFKTIDELIQQIRNDCVAAQQ